MAHFKKRLGLLLLPIMAAAPLALAQNQMMQGQAAPINARPFTDPSTVEADLARIDAALNGTESFSGRFTQYGADGTVDSGEIYLKKPGRMRFEYDAPNPLLIVSDGVTLIQQDRALETADRIPLATTPLNFFLKEDVDLARDTEVTSLLKDAQTLSVTARDGSGEMEGAITMVFDARNLALIGWNIADSFGGVTRVQLSDLKYNQPLNPRLFILRDDSRRDRRQR